MEISGGEGRDYRADRTERGLPRRSERTNRQYLAYRLAFE